MKYCKWGSVTGAIGGGGGENGAAESAVNLAPANAKALLNVALAHLRRSHQLSTRKIGTLVEQGALGSRNRFR
jgi:hypothetical protein